ncbi:hypothetical protein [Nocardia cyriacigeorgica]|uniref:hypothetical protein n=1 Tax=Nocardia cyriacigeorgica TaxID=135487 RepID=UPI0002F989F6|nr:hypothetical protein [Nocardia cyriacigeorgica]TLF59063.1 hypothetical protein FEK31_07405 [Nocardia cyriacigeorgica]
MTVSVLFEVTAAGHLVLACLCLRWFLRTRNRLLIIPLLLCLALIYDNAVIGAGRAIGTGALLELLSVPRYLIHAVLTPLLIPWARAVADRADVAWARSRRAKITTWALTACAIGLGVANDVIGLSLQPQQWAGTVRYSNIPAPETEALPVVITGVFVLVIAVALWLRHRYLPLLITAAIMTVAASLAANSLLLGNIGELIFVAGVVVTAHWVPRPPAIAPLPAGRITSATRVLGWIAFPLLIATTVSPSTGPSAGYDWAALAQAVYQVLLIIHAQLGVTTYGFPPKGNRLRRFHTGFGYANIPLLAAAQLLSFFTATTGLANLCSQLLLLTITVHVGVGVVFAIRRARRRRRSPAGSPTARARLVV